MAYLSPESREMDFGRFRETFFPTLFWIFPTICGPAFFEKMNLRRVLWPKCQVKKGSYIDPLVMRCSLKSEILIGIFHQNFSFVVKLYSLFLQYGESVLKKTQIFGPNSEPCSSCVAVDFCFFRKIRFLEKTDPRKRPFLAHL